MDDGQGLSFSTIGDALSHWANERPDRLAFGFLSDGRTQDAALTFRQLDQLARRLAARLEEQGLAGERALLVYPSGLDFIVAFFGCVYAGVTAVPVSPPRPNRPLTRIQSIAATARPKIALTTTPMMATVQRSFDGAPDLKILPWLTTDRLAEEPETAWQPRKIDRGGLAFLQFTSGATGDPKGVMVSHRALSHNLEVIRAGFRIDPHGRGVTWLPMFHDMGLIGGVLEPIFVGGSTTLLSPISFLQRPACWLQAISTFRGTISGGPNFAYELCLDKITPEERAGLDLSSWQLAFCGAEPIRRETLERFIAAFEPCGFRREAFYPSYGMAESVLMVTGGHGAAAPIYLTVEKQPLEQNRAVVLEPQATDSQPPGTQSLVGCGRALLDQQVCVVDPETSARNPDGEVGEIWVAGPSVAEGYWNQPELTAAVFQARLAGSDEGPFLRTGDLGFLRDGQLFVTGRLKDLIIIRGRNHYPQDIELTVERSHAALRPACGAAFSCDLGGQERLVIVQEVERRQRDANTEEVFAAIRQAVAEQHELQPAAIVLLKTLSIPKTTSGKISRRQCRAQFLEASLEVVAEWRLPLDEAAPVSVTSGDPSNAASSNVARVESAQSRPHETPKTTRSAQQVQAWLIERVAKQLRCPAAEIDIRQPLARYGLDSAAALSIAAQLEDWLGQSVPATLAYDFPTIDAISRYLTGAPEITPATETLPVAWAASAEQQREPVAIIGIGCRAPGAENPEAFWRLLSEGLDAVGEVSPARWNAKAFDDQDATRHSAIVSRWGGFLPDEQIQNFDPQFFGVSPREAANIDPQQRLLLELAWEALEDAGQAPAALAGSPTGVFVGISTSDYAQIALGDLRQVDAYWSIGNALSIAANRLSYFFDFRGPSLSVDTACSSSLVAIHLACQSLRSGESRLALAGGTSVILSPAVSISFSRGGALSADGRCRAFDAAAGGIVRGEGAGVVVLKLLSQAIVDGDPIYAVIRGGAVNQDGRTNGITAPSQSAQEAVLRDAYRQAGVSPADVQYVEAHGTGTLLGDPIELKALGAVLAAGRDAGRPCAVGSVKTNLGHLEAAAGIMGLIKVALSLAREQLPPSLHFETPNPHIPFATLPLRVQTELASWPAADGRRLAGVSAFGFGGTNAHLVLEGAPVLASGEQPAELRQLPAESSPATERPRLLPLSARTPVALRSLAKKYRELLAEPSHADERWLADACFTAALHRNHHDVRRGLVFDSRDELSTGLTALEKDAGQETASSKARRNRPRVAFVFSGHEAQWWGMGRQLLEREPVFREVIVECDRLLRGLAPWSLLAEMSAGEAESRLTAREVEISQTALFAVQTGLAVLWRSWGISPDAVVGHSVGEVAAAHAAEALSLPDALRVVFHRSRLMQRGLEQQSGQGAMAAVRLSMAEAEAALAGREGQLSAAVSNSPDYTIISGDADALGDLLQAFKRQRIAGRLLAAPGAGHSPQVEPLQPELRAALEGLQAQRTTTPIYSTILAEETSGETFDAAYWARNIREPVRFAATMEKLLAAGFDAFVEIGPHPVLTTAMTQCARAWDDKQAAAPDATLSRGREAVVLTSLRRGDDEQKSLLKTTAVLYELGLPPDWQKVCPRGKRVRLPSYPWQRERCWLDVRPFWMDESPTNSPAAASAKGAASAGDGIFSRRFVSAAHDGVRFWEIDFDAKRLVGQTANGAANFKPASAAIALGLISAVAEELNDERWGILDSVDFGEELSLDNAPRTVQIVLTPAGEQHFTWQIFSRAASSIASAPWSSHATGQLRLATPRAARPRHAPPDVLRSRGLEMLYRRGGESGRADDKFASSSPLLASLERRTGRDGEALGTLSPAAATPNVFGILARIAPLDACLRTLAAACFAERATGSLSPTAAMCVRFYGPLVAHAPLWSHAVLRPGVGDDDAQAVADVFLLDVDGHVLCELLGVHCPVAEHGHAIDASQTVAHKETSVAKKSSGTSPASNGFHDAGTTPAVPAQTRAQWSEVNIQALLLVELGKVLRLDPARIDVRAPLTDLNIDSLMLVELKNRLEDVLQTSISPAAVFKYPTVTALAGYLAEQAAQSSEHAGTSVATSFASNGHEPAPANATLPSATSIEAREAVGLLAQLDNLSNEDVDSLLARLLTEPHFDAWMAEKPA